MMTRTMTSVPEKPFFKQEQTLDALSSIADSRELVFYCGAGVTIDRTGVSWGQLMEGVFNLACAGKPGSKVQNKSVAYLVQELASVKHAASIMVEAFKPDDQSENDFLAPKLHDVLYQQSGWSRGYILRNLIQLSLAAATAGRNVQIITTNYDSYIEDEFIYRYDSLLDEEVPSEALPGLMRRDMSNPKSKVEVRPSGVNVGSIEIVYLHGRVDRGNAPAEGDLVLTEASYAKTHLRSAELLQESFGGREKSVLVIGASLTDEPLIHALAETKKDATNRFALLMTPPSLEDTAKALVFSDYETTISTKSVGQAFDLRGRHLGIQVLRTLNHSQSAQFLEELRLSVTALDTTSDASHYRTDSNGLNYADRLNHWHRAWASRKDTQDPEFAFTVLRDGLEKGIKLALKEKAPSGERFRVEVWARKNPRTSNRALTMWASSTGPVRDTTVLRSEALSRGSKNASVRAFMDGRPMLISIEELGLPASASRWQTFFSMPIYVQVDADIKGTVASTYVPAGVITLTSEMSAIAPNSEGQISVFAHDLSVDEFNKLKVLLIAMGRKILRPND